MLSNDVHEWIDSIPDRLKKAMNTQEKIHVAMDLTTVRTHLDHVKKQIAAREHPVTVEITIGDMKPVEHRVNIFDAAKLSWLIAHMERRR